MACSIRWHDLHEILSGICDGQLLTWYMPSVVFTDPGLQPNTKTAKDTGVEELSSNDRIQDFSSTRVGVRRGSDGALLTLRVNPHPSFLFAHIVRHDWEKAVRLSRFLNSELVWSVLTALALRNGELRTAVVGYGALGEVDKVRYLEKVKSIPSQEGRQAELALFCRRPDEAERILLQSGLVYRALDMHMRLFHWERALEIAVERGKHVDTVLCRRQRYLENVHQKETLDKFRQLSSSVTVDAAVVDQKVEEALREEQQRAVKTMA